MAMLEAHKSEDLLDDIGLSAGVNTMDVHANTDPLSSSAASAAFSEDIDIRSSSAAHKKGQEYSAGPASRVEDGFSSAQNDRQSFSNDVQQYTASAGAASMAAPATVSQINTSQQRSLHESDQPVAPQPTPKPSPPCCSTHVAILKWLQLYPVHIANSEDIKNMIAIADSQKVLFV